MDAGKFKERVRFERLTTTTDAEGSTVETWNALFSRWANVQINTAVETFKNNQNFQTRAGFALVRRDSDTRTLTANDRMIYDNEPWELLGVVNVQNSDEYLELGIRRYGQ